MALIMLITTGGCASSGKQPKQSTPAPKTEAVTLDFGVLRGTSAVSVIKMMSDKPALGQGVTVNYMVEQSPDVLSSKVLSGEMEFATIPTNMADFAGIYII
ncbi:MAG TPA: hypothetical protein VHP38_00365 [Ruminiclostridium sp.]|nr:hypothetical protein [Ruminiclostridium sp.]